MAQSTSTKKKELHIVKRKGHNEPFDSRKVYGSVYSAVISAHHSEQEAEMLAEQVARTIEHWIATKTDVTSSDIRNEVFFLLHQADPDVAVMYKHHLDLC